MSWKNSTMFFLLSLLNHNLKYQISGVSPQFSLIGSTAPTSTSTTNVIVTIPRSYTTQAASGQMQNTTPITLAQTGSSVRRVRQVGQVGQARSVISVPICKNLLDLFFKCFMFWWFNMLTENLCAFSAQFLSATQMRIVPSTTAPAASQANIPARTVITQQSIPTFITSTSPRTTLPSTCKLNV